MITCVVEYTIDATKTDDFELFGEAWIHLVNKHGGTHHGYFLTGEGAIARALVLFSSPSLADYESLPHTPRRRPRVHRLGRGTAACPAMPQK